MPILDHVICREELSRCAGRHYSDSVKGVVDVDRGLLAIDGEMHADLQYLLLENGSDLESLWGISLSGDPAAEDLIRFESLLNIRPWQGNRSISIADPALRERIREVVSKWIRD